MVASVDFFGAEATVWALPDVVGSDVVAEFGISNAVTRNASVTNSATLEAHLLAALADSCTRITTQTRLFLAHIIEAPNLGTPLQFRVKLNINILFESQELFEDFFAAEVLNVGLREVFAAGAVHTANFDDLAVLNFRFEVVRHAIFAEFVVAAGKAEKIVLLIGEAADEAVLTLWVTVVEWLDSFVLFWSNHLIWALIITNLNITRPNIEITVIIY